MKTKIFTLIFVLSLGVFGLGWTKAEAQNCAFYRNLGYGSRGSDVACLQQYLTSVGAGYLTPDGAYGNKTSQAVMTWQARNGLPITGYFDTQSINRYAGMEFSGGQVLGVSTDYSNYNSYLSYPNNSVSSEVRAREKIEKALDTIEDAEDEVDDSNKNTSTAENYLEDARDDIFDAIREFILNRDYQEAEDRADDAIQNAEDAIDEVDGGRGDRADARDAIDEANDAIDEAENQINYAESLGRDINDAWDYIDDARDSLDDAEDAYDDHEYNDAEDYADDATDYVDDALDEIDW